MKTFRYCLFALLMFSGGCAPTEETAPAGNKAAMDGGSAVADVSADGSDKDPAATVGSAPTSDADTQVVLSPANTKIEFVGTHTGDNPDPRTGSFAALSGTITLQADSVTAIQLEIDTQSLTTTIEKLTNHLKSPDFFSVREHPTAQFVSTSIEPNGDAGQVTVSGDLTLLGVTRSISFPASISTGDTFKLEAEFTIDRTEFGMDYGVENVEKAVTLTVAVDA